MSIEKLESAEEFAKRILKGMGFDLKLIGDAPIHIADEIEARDVAVARAAEERMQEMVLKDLNSLAYSNSISAVAIFKIIIERIRAIPLSTDAPDQEKEPSK